MTQLQDDMEAGRPACFPSEELWQLWLEVTKRNLSAIAAGKEEMVTHPKQLPHHSYCTDCHPGYAAEMRAAGLCEHPFAVAHENEDGVYMRRREKSKVIPIIQVGA